MCGGGHGRLFAATSPLQERREGALAEVGGVGEAASLTCEHEAQIPVQTADPQFLLHLPMLPPPVSHL